MTTALFDAPTSWQCSRLVDLCRAGNGGIQTGPFGSQLHAADYVKHGIPSVMPQNIGDNMIHVDGIARITPEDAKRLDRYLLAEGDIVYSRRGDVERRALVRSDQAGWLCGTGCLRIRPGTAVDSAYLSYYLGHADVRRWIVRHAIGATMANLSSQILGELPVLAPPRSTQQSIATLLSALDDKITVNNRIALTAVELAQSVFDHSATGPLVAIHEVASIMDGPHATPTKVTSGPWFLSISSLKAGLLDLGESVSMAAEEFSKWTRRVRPQEGDVLFSYETRLGEAALMLPGIRASIGRRMAVLRSTAADVSGALLLHAYLSSRFRRQISERAVHGATVDRIPLKELPSWRIPLPPSLDRARHSSTLTDIHRRAAASLLENRNLVSLRDSLIPELMSGKLCVKDAEKAVGEAV